MNQSCSMVSMLGAVFACAFVSCADPGDPSANPSSARQPIINGEPVTNPAPSYSHIVYIWADFGEGTGTLIDEDWVLTAAHVVRSASHSPGYVTIRRGNLSDSTAETRNAKRIEIHPAYVYVPGGVSGFSTDVALVQLESPFSVPAPPITISSLSAGQTANLTDIRCAGYGNWEPFCAYSAGTSRFADFDPIPPPTFPTRQFSLGPSLLNQLPAPADSGGPCWTPTSTQDVGELLGVLRATTNGCPVTSASRASVVAAAAFREWAAFVPQTCVSQVMRWDMDSGEDWAGVSPTEVKVFLSNGGIVNVATLPPGLLNCPPDLRVAIGNFDGTGFPDLVTSALGQLSYMPGDDNLQGWLPPTITFPVAYDELRTADLNDDGYDDVEAFVEGSSAPDVYYGSAQGLTAATALNGFPTSDGNDGKLLTLAVRPTASIGVPDYSFQVWASHPQGAYPQELHIEVFDGDLSGSHDELDIHSAPVRTCFLLYGDPLANGSGEAPIGTPWSPQPLVHQDDSHFRNNEWTSLFDPSPNGQQQFVGAKVPGDPWPGYDIYSYILRVFLTTGQCNQAPAYPDWAVANSLKIRVNDWILFWSSESPVNGSVGAISIVGSDSVGDYARLPACLPGYPCGFQEDVDTTYDGTWTFNIATTLSDPYTGPLPDLSEFWVSEADADSLLDTISPGSAVGANEEIDFRLVDDPVNPTAVFLHPVHPTGQYDPTLEPCARYDVWVNPPAQFPADVYWLWTDLLSHNNVWLSVPTTSAPGMCIDGAAPTSSPSPGGTTPQAVAALLLFGEKPHVHIPSTSASPVSFWLSDEGQAQIAPLLPIGLGTHGAKVHSPQQAHQILRRGEAPPHGSPASMTAMLKAEVLAAKLNMARGAAHGEDIARGYIYGTTDNVANVMDRAGQALSNACQGSHCTSPSTFAELISRLRAINTSNTTYRAPVAVQPAPLVQSAHGKAITTAPQTDFWRRH